MNLITAMAATSSSVVSVILLRHVPLRPYPHLGVCLLAPPRKRISTSAGTMHALQPEISWKVNSGMSPSRWVLGCKGPPPQVSGSLSGPNLTWSSWPCLTALCKHFSYVQRWDKNSKKDSDRGEDGDADEDKDNDGFLSKRRSCLYLVTT